MGYYVGIDPGKSGAIVFLDEQGEIEEIFSVPLIGKEYDILMMKDLLSTAIEHVVLENVHALQMGGKVSNFDFGRGKGIWEGLLAALEVPHTQVLPKEWQKDMWEGVNKQYKTGTKKKTIDTKATSLIAAQTLQPSYDWIDRGKSGRGTKVHDGWVDAYLMAEHCRRRFRK